MKVILDSNCIQPRLTGIGRYAYALIEGLLQHKRIAATYLYQHRKIATALPAIDTAETVLQKNQHWKRFELVRRLHGLYRHWDDRCFRKEVASLQPQIYHAPNFIARPTVVPTVVTIHDFSFLHFPEFHPQERLLFLQKHFPRTLAQAAHFITDSDFIKQEMIERYHLPADKITVIHLGVSKQYHPRTEAETNPVLQKHGLHFGLYLFSAATIEPRKNLKNILAAYVALPKNLQKQFPLVLAGSPGWLSDELHRQIQRLQGLGLLKYLGYIPESELQAIYAGARAFVFPSYYEGFGLPVLEAMASGTPVLTTHLSAMAEVTGSAAHLVNAEDASNIQQGLENLLTDDAYWAIKRAQGLEQAKRYTWDQCIEKTVAVYQQINRERS